MNLLAKIKLQKTSIISLLFITLLGSSINAQNNTTSIEAINGPELIISGKKTEVFVGSPFPSGTEFIVPSGTQVTLKANDNRQVLNENTTHTINLTNSGEEHITYDGFVTHHVTQVNRATYQAHGGTTRNRVITEGTVFTVQPSSGGVYYNTISGAIRVEEKKPVIIGEKSKTVREQKHTKKLSYTDKNKLEGNDGPRFVPNIQQSITFSTYDMALNAISNSLTDADDYLLVGGLYLENGNIDQAIDYLNFALDKYRNLTFVEEEITETYLSLADAYYEKYDNNAVNHYVNLALNLIAPELELLIEDYNYASADGDNVLMKDISIDLYYYYDNLAWAYELLEMDADANRSFDAADYYYRKAYY